MSVQGFFCWHRFLCDSSPFSSQPLSSFISTNLHQLTSSGDPSRISQGQQCPRAHSGPLPLPPVYRELESHFCHALFSLLCCTLLFVGQFPLSTSCFCAASGAWPRTAQWRLCTLLSGLHLRSSQAEARHSDAGKSDGTGP